MMRLNFLPVIAALTLVLASCNSDDDITRDIDVPETYSFERNGQSTVSYSGQENRLDMLSEMKTYLVTANSGAVLSQQVLLDMFANENNPFSTEDLNTSGKRLEDKTFLADIEFFKNVLVSASEASANAGEAVQGQSGLIARSPDVSILVNEMGWEYTQIIEKGLMGATFLNQIFNVYLTDARIGDAVDNEALVDGKNYTAMEHHWDEAFGYWGVPSDFDVDGNNRFWGNYTYGREAYLGSATTLKEAFLTGRTAIVNKNYNILNQQRDIIYDQFESISAATAIHYLNQALVDYNNGDQGNLFHHVSEGYGFVMALKYSPVKSISNEQIDVILNSNLGTNGDFWTITLEGLKTAKATLVEVYPEFSEFADEL